jgi:hypothetical protein
MLAGLSLALALTGCLDWQGTYDESARSQCRSLPNTSDRQACMASVARNSTQKRGDHVGH